MYGTALNPKRLACSLIVPLLSFYFSFRQPLLPIVYLLVETIITKACPIEYAATGVIIKVC